MAGQVKTFEEVEKSLFALEDQLIKDMADPEFKDSPRSPVEEIAKDIAADWVRYTRMARQGGVAPRYNVAIKHVAVLLGTPIYYAKELIYGRNEITKDESKKVNIPVLNFEDIVAVRYSDVDRVRPYTIGQRDGTELTLDTITNCRFCPARGKCDLTDKCNCYDSKNYHSVTPENSPKPVPSDFLTFEAYARTIKKK